MDFFKNGTGWCQRHGRRAKDPGPPVRSHSPILRKKEAISDKRQAPKVLRRNSVAAVVPSSKRQAPSSEGSSEKLRSLASSR